MANQLFPLANDSSAIFSPIYIGHTGKRRRLHPGVLYFGQSVRRALPRPSGEKACKWERITTPRGRRILVPKP